MINPPYVFPRLQLFVGNWCRVIHSNAVSRKTIPPPHLTLLKPFHPCGGFLGDGYGSVFVYFTVPQRQQLYPQCVPISPSKQWETASEQVQQRDREGLPAAHTKPVFGR